MSGMAYRTLEIAERISPDLVALRRELHQHPELGLRLPWTQARVLKALADLDVEITTGRELDSVVAVVRGRKRADGPVVLLRGDMDALPVVELTELPFASTNGAMHACGHDLHTAGLVGAARILTELRDELEGDVVLMFQPAEEGPGGAEPMLEEGLLDVAGRRVEAAYAMHVSSAEYPAAQWFTTEGACMAACDDAIVTVRGEGGHGSQAHAAKDPVPVACEIVTALQTMVTRGYDVHDPVVVTVGYVKAGSKTNIIPDDAELGLTVRSLSVEHRARLQSDIERLVAGITSAHGLTGEVQWIDPYPPTINDDAEYALGREVIADLFGPESYTEREPELGSEDFSYIMEQVPGAYFFLSACMTDDPAAAPDNHSPRAAFDDSVIYQASAWLAEMALRRCAASPK